MLNLKCTAKVQEAVGLTRNDLTDAAPSAAPLGDWYVNRFHASRRTVFIFMSEGTLLSFILFQGIRPVDRQSFPVMFMAGLDQLLRMRGVSEAAIDRALQNYSEVGFARTSSRADLGSLNDLMSHYRWIIESEGGIDRCDLTSIIMKLNEMPQRRLGWNSSWDATHSRLYKSS